MDRFLRGMADADHSKLPQNLHTPHYHYLVDLDEVAGWLGANALALGYPPDQITIKSSSVPQPKTGRLKGKERKLARGGQAKTVPEPAAASNEYISIDNFVTLAKFIANFTRGDVSNVHSMLRSITQLLMALRKHEKAFQGCTHVMIGTVRHSYTHRTLRALEEVFRTLWSPMLNPEDLENDPDMAFSQCDRPHQHFAGVEGTFEEAFFATHISIRCLSRIRWQLQSVWQKHDSGTFDLAACAATTHAASSLVRHMAEELSHVICNTGCSIQQLMCGLLETPPESSDSGEDGPSRATFDEEERHRLSIRDFLNTFEALLYCTSWYKTQSQALPNEWETRLYNPERDRAAMSDEQKLDEDYALLAVILSQAWPASQGFHVFWGDEFLRGLQQISSDDHYTITLSLVFATQVRLDIHHILRSKAKECCIETMKQVTAIRQTAAAYIAFKDATPDLVPDNKDRTVIMQRLVNFIDETTRDPRDPRCTAKSCENCNHAKPNDNRLTFRDLFTHDPILSGAYLFQLRVTFFGLSCRLVNKSDSVALAGHLYAALKSEGVVEDVTWPQMDVAMEVIGERNFWKHAKPPESALDLIQGFSTGSQAFTDALNGHLDSKDSARPRPHVRFLNLPDTTVIYHIVNLHKFNGQESIQWDAIDVLETIVYGAFETEVAALRAVEDATERSTIMQAHIESLLIFTQFESKKWVGHEPLEVIQMLSLRLDAVAATLTFPFLAIHQSAQKLVHSIWNTSAFKSIQSELYGRSPGRCELQVAVLDILLAAAGLHDRSKPGVQDMRLLRLAGTAVENMRDRPEFALALETAKYLRTTRNSREEHEWAMEFAIRFEEKVQSDPNIGRNRGGRRKARAR